MSEAQRSENQGRFSAHGHELDWELRGAGAPVVVLHSLATDRRLLVDVCEPVFAAETAAWSRLYFDLPGHGASSGNVAAAASERLLEAVAQLIVATTPQPVALVGYAFGAYLAQGLMALLGERVRGAFLICPTVEPDFGKRTVPPRRVARRDDKLAFSDDPREKIAFEEVAVQQTPAMLEAFQRLVHVGNVAANQEMMAATRAQYVISRPLAAPLANFAGPVTVLCGRDDHWVGFEDAARLVRLLRRGELHVLADCGHLLPIEERARMTQLLAQWLARI